MEKQYIQIVCENTAIAEMIYDLWTTLTKATTLLLITIFFYFLISTIRTIKAKKVSYILEDGILPISLPKFILSLYLVILAKITIIPSMSFFPENDINPESSIVVWVGLGLSSVNLVPFRSIISVFNHGFLYGSYNTIGNLLMLSPLTFLLLASKKANPKKAFIAGICCAFIIEFIQIFETRSVDIDDLLLNIGGAGIGCILFSVLKKYLCPKS